MASKTPSSDENWRKEAFDEQLQVFNSLTVPYKNFTEKKSLTLSVLDVTKSHLRCRSRNDPKRPTVIAKTVVNSVLGLCEVSKKNLLKLSFIVIVTDQKAYPEGLFKTPIFIVTLAKGSIFIDIDGKMFKSWNSFMQENTLPACKFCFPAGGHYLVCEKLNLEFASSRAAAQSLVKTSTFWNVVGNVADVVKVSASCLIKIAPICLKIVFDLKPVAERFVSRISTKHSQILTLSVLFFEFKNKKRSLCDLMISAYPILVELGKMILSELLVAWFAVKKCLCKAYNRLQSMFPRLFVLASPSSQHEFLALIERVDSETVTVENKAREMISAAKSGISASVFPDPKSTTYNKQIFSNSITECALSGDGGDKPFEKITVDLLNVTKEIANVQQVTTLDDLKNIFESVSFTVFAEYRHKIDTYSQSIKAARDATKGEFNMNIFNKSMKIEGEPEDHFMREALQSCLQSLRCIFKVNLKTEELKKHSKVVLIPLWKEDRDDDINGLYRSIGVRGTGLISPQALLDVLQENFGSLSMKTKSSTIDGMTTIHSDEFTALFSQNVNKENTSEGLLFFERCI